MADFALELSMKNSKWIFVLVVSFLIFFAVFKRYGTMNSGKDAPESVARALIAEVARTCHEADKYKKIFLTKYPTQGVQASSKALQSKEWHDAMVWQQACDTAQVDLGAVKNK